MLEWRVRHFDAIDQSNLVWAIASFERTLVTRPSYEAGTMSADAKRGL